MANSKFRNTSEDEVQSYLSQVRQGLAGQDPKAQTLARSSSNPRAQREGFRQLDAQAREQDRAFKEQTRDAEAAQKDAEQAAKAEEARRVRAGAAAGIQTTTDIETGRRTLDSNPDGSPKWKVGAVGDPVERPVIDKTMTTIPGLGDVVNSGVLGRPAGYTGIEVTQDYRNERGDKVTRTMPTTTDPKTGEISSMTRKDEYGAPVKQVLGTDTSIAGKVQRQALHEEESVKNALRGNTVAQARMQFQPKWEPVKRAFDDAGTKLNTFNKSPKFMRVADPNSREQIQRWVKRNPATGQPEVYQETSSEYGADGNPKYVKGEFVPFDPLELTKWLADKKDLTDAHARAKQAHDQLVPMAENLNRNETEVKAAKLKLAAEKMRIEHDLPDDNGGMDEILAKAAGLIDQTSAEEAVSAVTAVPSGPSMDEQKETADKQAEESALTGSDPKFSEKDYPKVYSPEVLDQATDPKQYVQGPPKPGTGEAAAAKPLIPTDDPGKVEAFKNSFKGMKDADKLTVGDSGDGYTFIKGTNGNIGTIEEDKGSNPFITVTADQQGDLRRHVDFSSTTGIPIYLQASDSGETRDIAKEAQYVASVFSAIQDPAMQDPAMFQARMLMLGASPNEITAKVRDGKLSVQSGESLMKGLYGMSTDVPDPTTPQVFGEWLAESDSRIQDYWKEAKTPEDKDYVRAIFMRQWTRENGWKPGVTKGTLEYYYSQVIKGREAEGIIMTATRQVLDGILPALGTAGGAILGSGTALASGIGAPATVAAGIAGGTAGGYLVDSRQEAALIAVMGPEWVANHKKQIEANAQANPGTAMFGDMAPLLISMMGNPAGTIKDAGTKAVVAVAITKAGRAAAAAGTKAPMLERMARGGATFARAEGSLAAQQEDASAGTIAEGVVKGGLLGGSLGMLPEAIIFVPQAKSLADAIWSKNAAMFVGERAMKGTADALTMTLASTMYESATTGKLPDWERVAAEFPGTTTAFVAQTVIMGMLHRTAAGRANFNDPARESTPGPDTVGPDFAQRGNGTAVPKPGPSWQGRQTGQQQTGSQAGPTPGPTPRASSPPPPPGPASSKPRGPKPPPRFTSEQQFQNFMDQAAKRNDAEGAMEAWKVANGTGNKKWVRQWQKRVNSGNDADAQDFFTSILRGHNNEQHDAFRAERQSSRANAGQGKGPSQADSGSGQGQPGRSGVPGNDPGAPAGRNNAGKPAGRTGRGELSPEIVAEAKAEAQKPIHETDPAVVAKMHPNDYADWLKSNVDVNPAKQIPSSEHLDVIGTALSAARARGDVATEQALTARIHGSQQRTDYRPEELGIAPAEADSLNKAARQFNMDLEAIKARFGIKVPENAPQAPEQATTAQDTPAALSTTQTNEPYPQGQTGQAGQEPQNSPSAPAETGAPGEPLRDGAGQTGVQRGTGEAAPASIESPATGEPTGSLPQGQASPEGKGEAAPVAGKPNPVRIAKTVQANVGTAVSRLKGKVKLEDGSRPSGGAWMGLDGVLRISPKDIAREIKVNGWDEATAIEVLTDLAITHEVGHFAQVEMLRNQWRAVEGAKPSFEQYFGEFNAGQYAEMGGEGSGIDQAAAAIYDPTPGNKNWQSLTPSQKGAEIFRMALNAKMKGETNELVREMARKGWTQGFKDYIQAAINYLKSILKDLPATAKKHLTELEAFYKELTGQKTGQEKPPEAPKPKEAVAAAKDTKADTGNQIGDTVSFTHPAVGEATGKILKIDADGKVHVQTDRGIKLTLEPSTIKKPFSKASTQINLPLPITKEVQAFAAKIPNSEIYDAEEGFGREDEVHVTVLYGLTSNDSKQAQKALQGSGPITFTLGKLSIFENEKYDVLKIDVSGKQLHAANKALKDGADFESDYPDYKPHVTIAYLKKGEGAKYVGGADFEGKQVTSDSVLYSGKDRTKTPISLSPASTAAPQPKPAEASAPDAGEPPSKKKPARALRMIDSPGVASLHADTVVGKMREMGRLMSKAQAKKLWKKVKFGELSSQWDGAKDLTKNPSYNGVIYGGTQTPSDMATALYKAGVLPDDSVNALWDAMHKAVGAADTAAKRARSAEQHYLNPDKENPTGEDIAKAEQDIKNADFDQANNFDFGRDEVIAGDLKEGQKVTIDGEEFTVKSVDPEGKVVLQDGARFGKQVLDSGEMVYVEEPDADIPVVKSLVDEAKGRGYISVDAFQSAEPAEYAAIAAKLGIEPRANQASGDPREVPQAGEADARGGSGAGQRQETVTKPPVSKMDVKNADAKELFADDGGFQLGQETTKDGDKIVAERKAKEDAKAAMDAAQGDMFAQKADKPKLTPEEQALKDLEDLFASPSRKDTGTGDLFGDNGQPSEAIRKVKIQGSKNAFGAYKFLTAKRNAGKPLTADEEQTLLDAETALGQKMAFDMAPENLSARQTELVQAAIKEATTPPQTLSEWWNENKDQRPISEQLKEAITKEKKASQQSLFMGEEGKGGQGSLFSSPSQPAPFYSQLSNTLEAKMPKSAPVAQVLAIAKGGSKAEEFKWSGIEQAAQRLAVDGKVDKAALLDWLATEGAVKFEEVTLSDPDKKGAVHDWAVSDGENNTYFRSYQEAAEYADQQGINITEDTVFQATNRRREASNPKYAQYVIPGGENYREVVLAMPLEEGTRYIIKQHDHIGETQDDPNETWFTIKNVVTGKESDTFATREEAEALLREKGKGKLSDVSYTSSHFPDVPNYVAHMRLNERPDASGAPGLFIEELQSDRHQAGRSRGYQTEDLRFSPDQIKNLRVEEAVFENSGLWVVRADTPDGPNRILSIQHQSKDAAEANLAQLSKDGYTRSNGGTIPDAPYRSSWPLALFKRALRAAVASDKSWIGFTTGRTQSDRFDLSQHLDSIQAKKGRGSEWELDIKPKNSGPIVKYVDESLLADEIGKDMADKIVSDGGGTYTGLDLKIESKGMIGFYDGMLPKEIQKYVKQWGAKVEKSFIPTKENQSRWVYTFDDGSQVATVEEAEALVSERGEWTQQPEKRNADIWKVSITPEMKAGVEAGQALFSSPSPDNQADYAQTIKPTVLPKLMPVLGKLVESGKVKTPEALAEVLTKLDMQRFSQPLWQIAAALQGKTGEMQDWAKLYAPKEVPKKSLAELVNDALKGSTKSAGLTDADKLRNQADKLTKQAMAMLDGIEPGQPVLSTADRNKREKAAEIHRKASDLLKQAEEAAKPADLATPAKRSKPQAMVEFANPITGPSGAKLKAYEWVWTMEEVESKRDGELVGKRVSDWDKSNTNQETGREMVHQFHITDANGDNKLVSLESALQILGYTEANATGAAPIKSLASTLKTRAKNQIELERLQPLADAQEAAYERYRVERDKLRYEAMPKPVFSMDGTMPTMKIGALERWGQLSTKEHFDKLDKYQKDSLQDQWRMEEAGTRSGYSTSGEGYRASQKVRELKDSIAKLDKKIAAATPATVDAPSVGDYVTFSIPAIVYAKGEPKTIQTKKRGKVVTLKPNGQIEVRVAEGGYHTLKPGEYTAESAKPTVDAPANEAEPKSRESLDRGIEVAKAEYDRAPTPEKLQAIKEAESLLAMADQVKRDSEAYQNQKTPDVEPKPAETPAPTPAKASVEPITDLLSLRKFFANIQDGDVTAAQIKAGWETYKQLEPQIHKEIAKMTMKELERFQGMRKPDNKAEAVRNTMHALEGQFNPGAMLQYGGFTIGRGMAENAANSRRAAMDKAVATWTDETIQAQAQERRDKQAAKTKALENPETKDEWEQFVRRKGVTAVDPDTAKEWDKIRSPYDLQAKIMARGETRLTPEQLAAYDEVRGFDRKAQAQQEAERKAVVRGVQADTPSEIIETKHTKTGVPLFVVKLADRVERDVYLSLNAAAKKLGGYYSSYRGGGAVPGFQFKDMATAEQFQAITKGETVDRAEAVQERRETRKNAAAERLTELAERMEQKAEGILAADRKTNTQKRAREAAGQESAARKIKADAATIRNLADAIESGEAKHLDGVKTGTQVDALLTLTNDAKRRSLKDKDLSYDQRMKQEDDLPTPEQMDFAEYPYPYFDRSSILQMVAKGRETPGLKRVADRVAKIRLSKPFEQSEGGNITYEADIEDVRKLAKHVDRSWTYTKAKFDRYDRVRAMGLNDLPSLRAALREVLQFREGAAKEDPIKKMERDLIGKKIDGFFPTPQTVIEEMLDMAGDLEGKHILEPSGGKGDIADAARAAGAIVDVAETQASLRAILEARGHRLAGRDFMEMDPNQRGFTYGDVFKAPDGKQGVLRGLGGNGSERVRLVDPEGNELGKYNWSELEGIEKRGAASGYDAILMNPPFENGQDAEHVQHAYQFLKPGGKLVAIMGEGSFGNSSKKAQAFRDWLESVEGESQKLPEGSFKSAFRPTGVNTRMVTIEKPASTLAASPSQWPRDLYAYTYRTESNRGDQKHIVRAYNERTGMKEDRVFDSVAEANEEMARLDDLGSPALFSSPSPDRSADMPDPDHDVWKGPDKTMQDVFRDYAAGKSMADIAKARNLSDKAVLNIVTRMKARFSRMGVPDPTPPVSGGKNPRTKEAAVQGGAASRIPVSPFPVGDIKKGVSAPKVIETMQGVLKSIGFDVPLRIGNLRNRRALGEYYTRDHLTRIKIANDIPTAAHELGHALQRAIVGNDPQAFQTAGTPANAISEMEAVGRALYGSTVPAGGYVSEGFAEWFSVLAYGGNAEARAAAPRFHDWFKAEIEAKNPKLAKSIVAAQAASLTWRNQGDKERARQSIYHRPGRIAEFGKKVMETDVPRDWVDTNAPLDRFVAEAASKGGTPIADKDNPAMTATGLRMTHSARAEFMVKSAMIDFAGNKVGKALEEVLAPVRRKKSDFAIYLWAKRAMALWNDPNGARNPGLSEADAIGIIADLETPLFQRVASEVYKWNDQVLDYAAEASPDYKTVVDRIRAVDPGFYIPLKREFDAFNSVARTGGSAASGKLLDRLRGSGRRVKEPFTGMIAQAADIVLKAHQKRVLDQIFKIADSTPDMGHLVTRVPRSMVPAASRDIGELIDEINRKLRGAGIDELDITPEQEALMDELVSFFTPAYKPTKQGEHPILPVFRNGKLQWYQMDADLYETLSGMDGYRLPAIVDMTIGLTNRTFRIGTTGLRAAFSLVTNPLRDFSTLHYNSRASANTAELFLTWMGELSKAFLYSASGGAIHPKTIDTLERLGVKMATPLGQDTRPTERAARRLFETTGWKIVDIRNWADYARDLLQFPEIASRATEMKLLGKDLGWKPGDPLDEDTALRLLIASKQVTTDFTAAGGRGRVMNQVVPFFNAGIQGPRAHARAIKGRPVRFMSRALGHAVAALVVWWMNKDSQWWQEMPMKMKFGFTFIPFEHDGKKELIRIPKAFEADGLFMSGSVALADAWYREEPEKATEWMTEWFKRLVPPVTPQVVKVAAEQLANRKFFYDMPIVPRSQEEMARPEQIGPYTSKLAARLGAMTNASPERIDHAINGIFGGAGSDLVELFGRPKEINREKELTDLPVIGTLFVRGGQSTMNGQSVNALYAAIDAANKIQKSNRMVESREQGQLRLMLTDAQKAITAIGKIQQLEFTTEQRRELELLQTEIARDAVEAYQNGDFNRAATIKARKVAEAQLEAKQREAR